MKIIIKLLFFILICVTPNLSWAQTECKNDVSTDINNPTNSSLPVLMLENGDIIPTGNKYLNGFDWLPSEGSINTQYTTYNMFFNGTTPYEMNNIMSTSIPEYSYISVGIAPLIENGWELLLVNLGRFPNDNDAIPVNANNNTAFPYIVLYNKYSGIIRVFTNFGGDSDAGQGGNALQITLGFEYPNTQDVSGILRLYNGVDQALNETTNIIKSSSLVVKPAQGSHWASADFQIAYDPCTCFNESRLQIGIVSFLTSNVTLSGRSIATDVPITDASGNINSNVQDFLNGFELTGTAQAEDGIVIYKTILSSIDEYEAKVQKFKDKLDAVSEHNKKVNRNLLVLKAAKFVIGVLISPPAAAAAKVTKKIVVQPTDYPLADDLYDLQKGFVKINSLGQKFFDTKKVMDAVKVILGEEGKTFITNNFEVKKKPSAPKMPTVTLSEMKYSGTISTPASIGAVSFYNPGVYGSASNGTPPLSDYYEYPIYNEVLGTFALLRKPRIKISEKVIDKKNNLYNIAAFNYSTLNNHVNLKRFQSWERNYQIQLNEGLKFAINDVLDVKEYTVKAAYSIKAKPILTAPPTMSNKYLNAIQGSENINTDATNSQMQTVGYPIIQWDQNTVTHDGGTFFVDGDGTLKFPNTLEHNLDSTLLIQTPYIPIDAFKPFTAGISVTSECISYATFEGTDTYEPSEHTLALVTNNFGYKYELEIELKLMVDIEYNTVNSEGVNNSSTLLLTYPIGEDDIYYAPNELVSNLPNSLKNIGQYEKVREYRDVHFSGQDVPGCSKSTLSAGGDFYACYAIDEIVINGDITVANDGTKVLMRAGSEINVIDESNVSPEIELEIFNIYDYSQPMPKVNQEYVTNYCQGINGQNFAYAANKVNPTPKSMIDTTISEDEVMNQLNENFEMIVYPNPAKGNVNVRVIQSKDASGDISLQITDVSGRKMNIEYSKFSNDTYVLDISSCEKGTYFIRVTNNGKSSVKSLVIQ